MQFSLAKNFVKILLLILALQSKCFAQDKIILFPRLDTLLVKVKLIESGLVYFSRTDSLSSDSIQSLNKVNIARILFEDGRVMRFNESYLLPTDTKPFANGAIKLNLHSIIVNSPLFAYEYRRNRNNSIELGLGLVGVGWNDESNEKMGLFLRAGNKYYFESSNPAKRYRDRGLKGVYFRTDLFVFAYGQNERYFNRFGSINYNHKYYEKYEQIDIRTLSYGYGIDLNLGYQWTIFNKITIDYYIGYGLIFNKQKILNQESTFKLSETSLKGIYHDDKVKFGEYIEYGILPIQIVTGLQIGGLFFRENKNNKR